MERLPQKIENQVLSIVRQFLVDSGAKRAVNAVTPAASLERELGIGSLERAELFHRIEKAYHIQLPNSLMTDAKTVKDIIRCVKKAKPVKPVSTPMNFPIVQPIHIDVSSAKTLLEVLEIYAAQEPERPHIFFQDEYGKEEIIRYGQLLTLAKKTAQGLINKGIKPGETVAIMLPTAPEFFYAFFGVLFAGGVPVPIYPPFRAHQIDAYAKRETRILRNAGVRLLITTQETKTLGKLLQIFVPSLLNVMVVASLMKKESDLPDLSIDPDDSALIQYTSGSTGDPKGVLLNHYSLLANIRAYGEGIGLKPTDVCVSWLPLYHDMGLIGAWFGSLYHGIPLALLSPLTFLSRPERWLWAIHYHRATLSAAPNFAYELCLKKIDSLAVEGLDLSSWRIAFNGAEMVYSKTMENFSKRFQRYGFNKASFMPVYGLAECSLALTFPPVNRGLRVDRVNRLPFEKEGCAIPVSSEEKSYYEFVSCGHTLSEHEVCIVDAKNKALEERHVGSIQFRGPSAMSGYYRNLEATEAIYHDGWWDTGDLGYLADGELFITGRKKDLIIKAGRNYYPAEIESIAGEVPGIRQGCIASFGVADQKYGTEKLIIVAETDEKNKMKHKKIIQNVINKTVSQLGIPPDEVVLVPRQTIPKTSSGKIRRADCKASYLSGELGRTGLSVKREVFQLFLSAAIKKLGLWFISLIKIIYNIYLLVVIMITLLPLWFFVVLLPRQVCFCLFRIWCRWMFRFGFSPITIKTASGSRYIKKSSQPRIFVANHASYLDVPILAGVLPEGSCFVAKQELLKVPVVRSFIKKLGVLTIDRMDFSKSQSDVKRIEEVLKSGRSVIIFPEGTFGYPTGILPFKSGAFKVAVETGFPICSVAIAGARKLLRANRLLCRPAAIKVTICEPIKPEGNDWHEVVRLRESSRLEIAKYSGEQTVDLVLARLPRST